MQTDFGGLRQISQRFVFRNTSTACLRYKCLLFDKVDFAQAISTFSSVGDLDGGWQPDLAVANSYIKQRSVICAITAASVESIGRQVPLRPK